jgi:hypothetical protein
VGRRTGGVEAIGQSMLTAFAYLLLLGVALIPALVAGGLVFAVLRGFLGMAAVIPASLAGAGVLLGESWILTAWLGGVFARTDPSAVAPADG